MMGSVHPPTANIDNGLAVTTTAEQHACLTIAASRSGRHHRTPSKVEPQQCTHSLANSQNPRQRYSLTIPSTICSTSPSHPVLHRALILFAIVQPRSNFHTLHTFKDWRVSMSAPSSRPSSRHIIKLRELGCLRGSS